MNGFSATDPRGRMHLLTVTACVSRRAGGLFHSVRRLSQAVAARGVPVEVLSLEDPDTAADVPSWSPLIPRTYPAGPAMAYSGALRRALDQMADADAVCHVHGIWLYPSKAAYDASHRRRMPRMISPRGMLDPWALRVSRWKKRIALALFERKCLESAGCLHALCDSERDSIRQFGLKGPVAVVANGADLPGPAPTSQIDPSPSDWASRKVLLFLGRIHPKKGLLPLLEGWARAKRFGEDWRLAIAGPNEVGHREEVQERVAALRLGDSVFLLGPQFGQAKDAWLRRADAFVLTSHSEGFPMAVLEAMAYRLPVLLSPTCNFPQAAREQAAIETAVDADAIADALRRLYELSDVDRAAMGTRGFELIARDYTWPRIAEKMIDVYSWLLGRGERPDCVHLD